MPYWSLKSVYKSGTRICKRFKHIKQQINCEISPNTYWQIGISSDFGTIYAKLWKFGPNAVISLIFFISCTSILAALYNEATVLNKCYYWRESTGLRKLSLLDNVFHCIKLFDEKIFVIIWQHSNRSNYVLIEKIEKKFNKNKRQKTSKSRKQQASKTKNKIGKKHLNQSSV